LILIENEKINSEFYEEQKWYYLKYWINIDNAWPGNKRFNISNMKEVDTIQEWVDYYYVVDLDNRIVSGKNYF
jgi:hypothetical protein